MYFKLFEPKHWRKRSAEARRRNCAVLPLVTYPDEKIGNRLHKRSDFFGKICILRKLRFCDRELIGGPGLADAVYDFYVVPALKPP